MQQQKCFVLSIEKVLFLRDKKVVMMKVFVVAFFFSCVFFRMEMD